MVKRAFYRLRQFFLAITSRLTDLDRAFVAKYLSIPERALFEQLPRDEQKHSIIVARKMITVAHGTRLDERLLAKIGLLHDVGKSAVRLGLFDRSLMVVLKKTIRPTYDLIALRGKEIGASGFERKFHVHKEHASIGAELLRRAGTEASVVLAIEGHDEPGKATDTAELKILRKVDDVN